MGEGGFGDMVNSWAQTVGAAQQAAWQGLSQAASAVLRKGAAAGLLGAEAAAGAGLAAAGTAGGGAVGVYQKAKRSFQAVRQRFSPAVAQAQPCMPCLAQDSGPARSARIRRRQDLVAQTGASADPAVRAASARLGQDTRAVELARLSDNAYAQYDPSAGPDARQPPQPWQAVSDPAALSEMGLDSHRLSVAKAVVYRAPSDFPFEPKTVLAFRGTADAADVLADHDQALGLENAQYSAAEYIGSQLRDYGVDAVVTGHSLGGGKAQAAGVAGHLKGEMFNAAGLHPKTVGFTRATDLEPYAAQFVQYRAAGGLAQGGGDPLTGLQNSPRAQRLALRAVSGAAELGRANQWALAELGVDDPLALLPEDKQGLARDIAHRLLNVTTQEAGENLRFSGGRWHVPPALGEVRGLTSTGADGQPAGIAQQHSLTQLIYGFEHRKAADIQTLLQATGQPQRRADYTGPMTPGR